MFCSDPGTFMPGLTENARPLALPFVGYGSCPMITTFTFDGGVSPSAAKICARGGKMLWVDSSDVTNSSRLLNDGASIASPSTVRHASGTSDFSEAATRVSGVTVEVRPTFRGMLVLYRT